VAKGVGPAPPALRRFCGSTSGSGEFRITGGRAAKFPIVALRCGCGALRRRAMEIDKGVENQPAHGATAVLAADKAVQGVLCPVSISSASA
jgi:hypothetical protein